MTLFMDFGKDRTTPPSTAMAIWKRSKSMLGYSRCSGGRSLLQWEVLMCRTMSLIGRWSTSLNSSGKIVRSGSQKEIFIGSTAMPTE
jgi:hypothetical protein